MSTICHLSVSLDGYVAGPDQGLAHPLGVGGERLHEWMTSTAMWKRMQGVEAVSRGVDDAAADAILGGVGAFIMGRNMFAPGRGAWDLDWRGWWGEDPPYHAPVFVLTHHAREPLAMAGDTTFHFVTDGIEAALARARAAAGAEHVAIAGGAQTAREFIAAGLLDELHLHISPVLLGAGELLFVDLGDPVLKPIAATHSAHATHVSYRVSPPSTPLQ